MLFIKTIEPNTLSILKRLQSLSKLEKFDLVGGTASALRQPLVAPVETVEGIRLSSKRRYSCDVESRIISN